MLNLILFFNLTTGSVFGEYYTIAQVYPNTPHQKCIIHLQGNLQTYVSKKDRQELAQDIRAILSPDDPNNNNIEVANKSLINLAKKWGGRSKSLAKKIRKMEWQPYFTYLDYHVKVRRILYTTNCI